MTAPGEPIMPIAPKAKTPIKRVPESELASCLRDQLQVKHEVMMRCAEMNAKQFNITVPKETGNSVVLKLGFGRFCNGKLPIKDGIRRMKARECFSNATHLVLRYPERFIYCEGYGITQVLGFSVGEHAWVLDRDNDYAVVDPTWSNTAGAVYLGLPIRREYLYAKISESGYYGLLCNVKLGCCPAKDDPEKWLQPVPARPDF